MTPQISYKLSQEISRYHLLLLVAFCATTMTGCFRGPGFMQPRSAAGAVSSATISQSTEAAIVGSFGANSTVTQTLTASNLSDIGGDISLSFPPGALSIAAKITVEAGAAIAGSSVASELNLDSAATVSSAGPAVMVRADKSINTAQPFSLSIPVTSSALFLADSDYSYVVIFLVEDAATGKTKKGVITDVTVTNGQATFKSTRFGIFEVAIVRGVKEVKAAEVETKATVRSKSEEKALPKLEFSDITMDKSPSSAYGSLFQSSISGMSPEKCMIFGSPDKNKICGQGVVTINGSKLAFDTETDKNGDSKKEDQRDGCKDGADIYVRFECTSNDGRLAKSNWSNAFRMPERDRRNEDGGRVAIQSGGGLRLEDRDGCRVMLPYDVSASGSTVRNSVDANVYGLDGFVAADLSSSLSGAEVLIHPAQLFDGLSFTVGVTAYTTSGASNDQSFRLALFRNIYGSSPPDLPLIQPSYPGDLHMQFVPNAGAGMTLGACSQARSSIAVGNGSACVVTEDGSVQCWGAGANGQMGDGTNNSLQYLNSKVLRASDSTILKAFVVAAGDSHMCAIDRNGDVFCWGNGGSGRLGNNATANNSKAVKVQDLTTNYPAVAVGAGDSHSCALLSNGSVKCWGSCSQYQVNSSCTTSPYYTSTAQPTTIDGTVGNRAISLGVGHNHNCAVMENRTVQCWGSSGYGKAGGNSSNVNSPTAVSGATNFVAVYAGIDQTCGIKTDGSAACWGNGTDGQRGDNNVTASMTTPQAVVLGADDNRVVGISLGDHFSCFLLNNYNVRCTGSMNNGRLGNGQSTSMIKQPKDDSNADGLNAFFTAASSDKYAIAISSYKDTSCGVSSQGQVHCWGVGSTFLMANGSDADTPSPSTVKNSSGTNDYFNNASIGSGYRVEYQ